MAARTANSARPSSIGSPVPGEDLASIADKFMSSTKATDIKAPAAGSLDETANSYMQPAPPPAAEPTAPGAAGQVLDAAGRVLDYPGGFARAGLASAAGLAAGQGEIVKPEDLKAAAVGKGPNSAEYLRRLGVSEGGHVDVPVLGRVTVRGAEGLALDVLTDPLTAISRLVKEVPFIGKLINAPGAASEAVGEAVYKSGLKKVDAKLIEKGQDAISPMLLEAGATGTTEQLAKQVDNMSNAMGGIRKGLYDKANALGVAVDLSQPFTRAEAVLAKMKTNPTLVAAAEHLEDMLNQYKSAGSVAVDVLSDWKTNLYQSLPSSAFDGFGKLKGESMKFKAALASDMRQAIVDAGNSAEKGLGDSINAVNDKWGTLLAAKKPMQTQAKQAAGQGIGSWIDAAILGSGHTGALAAKKTFDLANTTYARTKFGNMLVQAGKDGIANAAASRLMIDAIPPVPEQSATKPPRAAATLDKSLFDEATEAYAKTKDPWYKQKAQYYKDRLDSGSK